MKMSKTCQNCAAASGAAPNCSLTLQFRLRGLAACKVTESAFLSPSQPLERFSTLLFASLFSFFHVFLSLWPNRAGVSAVSLLRASCCPKGGREEQQMRLGEKVMFFFPRSTTLLYAPSDTQ